MTFVTENMALLTGRPEHVEALKQHILSLAVRGLLVPQEEGDEPAGEVLRRIGKKTKKFAPIKFDEPPYELPEGWEWCRLIDLGYLTGGGTPSKNSPEFWDGDILWVTPKDMKSDVIYDSQDKITSKGLQNSSASLIPPQSILIVGRSGILKRTLPVGVNAVECTVNQDIKVLVPFFPEMARYIQLMLKGHESLILKELVKGGTTVQSLKYDQFQSHPFPLPPLPEQHRIVAKVASLFALIDRLSAAVREGEETRRRWLGALLRDLGEARSGEEVRMRWGQLSAHFDELIDSVEAVKALRQVILQLAVRGVLVEQDAADEPAGELLRRIKAEKGKMGKKGEVLAPVGEGERPFELPRGWEWCRIISISRFIDYRGKTPKKIEAGVRLITAKNVKFGYLSIHPEEFISESDYPKWMTRGFPETGDILFTTEAPLGNVCQLSLEEKVALAQRIITIQPIQPFFKKWLLTVLMSDPIRKEIYKKATGTTALGIKSSRLKLIPFPLPPLSEQRRIVERVERLMGWCDGLEGGIEAREGVLGRVVRGVARQG